MSYYALDEYTGNGSTDTFAITFDRILDTHVKVYVDESLQTDPTHYAIVGDDVVFVTPPDADAKIEFIRNTSQAARLVDYMQAAGFQEATLDQDSIQGFYMAQEAIDAVTKGILEALDAVAGTGQVPGASNPGDNGKVLTAFAGLYSWEYISTGSLAISTAVKALADAADLAEILTLLGLVEGTSEGNIIKLLAGGKLPAVDGSNLTNVPAVARSDAPPAVTHNGTDADHDMNIATGSLKLDNGTVVTVPALTKQIDAAWAVGTNQGGLDTGTVQANTWYGVWVIYRSDTGVTDVMYSTDATTPSNLPTGYDDYRRIDWVLTDGSANIIDSSQDGDRRYWKTPVSDANSASFGGTSAVTPTVTAPPNTVAVISLQSYHASSATNVLATVIDYQNDTAPSATAFTVGNSGGQSEFVNTTIKLDSNSQFRLRASQGAAVYSIVVQGWIDRRGRDD